MRRLPTRALPLLFVLLSAACGTIATPIWEKPEPTATRPAPTRTPIPTATIVQPTAVPPTATPSAIPPTATLAPELPTASPVPPTEGAAVDDPISVLVSLSNPQHGQELFNTFFDQAGFMCATCHRVDSEERLIGPGLLNAGVRAGTPGHQSQPGVPEAPERYIYESITDPNLFVVADFPANLMPQVYKDILSEQDIYDLIAYLMMLK